MFTYKNKRRRVRAVIEKIVCLCMCVEYTWVNFIRRTLFKLISLGTAIRIINNNNNIRRIYRIIMLINRYGNIIIIIIIIIALIVRIANCND